MTTMQEADPPAAMIDRVASLLDVFVGRRSLTLAEIVERSRLPRSSAHRILQRLVELRWVERRGSQYGLGLRMFEFGSQVVRQRRPHTAALPIMDELHRRTGCSAYLSVLVDADVLHLERVGTWPREEAWGVGSRHPVAQSASGWALLAAIDAEEWPNLSFSPASTRYGIRSMLELHRELEYVRARGGVAVDSQRNFPGVTVVAAPVGVDEFGDLVVLSLCGPASRVRTDAVAAAVRDAAVAIWRSTAGMPRSRSLLLRPVRASPPSSPSRWARADVADKSLTGTAPPARLAQ